MFVDIHSHIIPGIDDGAADMAEALEMLKLAANDWTRYIVATPHFTPAAVRQGGATIGINGVRNTSSLIRAKTEELTAQAVSKNIDIKLRPGVEVLISPDVPELLESGDICSLNGSRYLLVEFPMTIIPSYTSDILYKIQLFGLTPIIAHPERHSEVIKDMSLIGDLVDRGMLLQVNAGSLTGLFGRKIQKLAFKLIKSGLVHFVASDAHSCGGRSPELGIAAGMVEKKFGREVMQNIFYSNGLAVLEDKKIL